MKYLFRPLIALSCLTLLGAPASAGDINPGHIDLTRFSTPPPGGEFVSVNVSSNLIAIATRLVRAHEPAAAEILQDLKLVQVNVFGMKRGEPTDMLERFKSIGTELTDLGWDQIVSAQKKGEDVRVYVKVRTADAVEGLVVTAIEGDREAVLVNIVGNIRPENLALVGERLGIDHLKKAGMAFKKK